jgi:hypothetical protein
MLESGSQSQLYLGRRVARFLLARSDDGSVHGKTVPFPLNKVDVWSSSDTRLRFDDLAIKMKRANLSTE